jgi:hypothetical protein
MTDLVVIETPVTDYLYDETKADRTLRDAFFHLLSPKHPPRKGDNLLVPAEEWQNKLVAFGRKNGLPLRPYLPLAEQATRVRDRIFGKPVSIEAGGALANSFDAIVKTTVDGRSLVDGLFVTAVGEGVSGDVFTRSLAGHLLMPPPQGWPFEAHVFPFEGDRILLSIPSFDNPPSRAMTPALLDQAGITPSTRLVMLGGYMKYTGLYETFLDKTLDLIAATASKPQQRPPLVLTTAAQEIAASPELRRALDRAHRVTRVVVSANTGEFRRLLDLDTAWRKPFDAAWIRDGKPLKGNDLERAKNEHAAYQAAKRAANQVAFEEAFDRYSAHTSLPVTFVVTNGKKGVQVVSARGLSEPYPVPPAPYGVVNTVGGGDAFWGGYALGLLLNMPEKDCVRLGFVNAGQVIGQNEARLAPRQTMRLVGGKPHRLGHLAACLDPANEDDRAVLGRLIAAAPTRPEPPESSTRACELKA